MSTAALIEQAKAGDADAIAQLLTQAFAKQGITVTAERQSYRLVLHLVGKPLPDQSRVVATIRRGIQRLQIDTIGVVQIHCTLTDQPGIGWQDTIALLGTESDEPPVTAADSPPQPSAAKPSRHSPAAATAIPATFVDEAFATLGITSDATAQEVDEAYFHRRAELLSQGDRGTIAQLKTAHALLKRHLQPSPTAASEEAASESTAVDLGAFVQLLRSHGLDGTARVKDDRLQIQLKPAAAKNPNRAAASVYTLLAQQDLKALGLTQITQVEVYGLVSAQKVGWKRQVPLPPPASKDDTDVLSFNNRHVSAIVFPTLMLLGIFMNALPLVNAMLFGVKIWFHEFGHAIIAWLAGRRAIPLPIGWTNVDLERSLFVYFGILILLGLLFWVGRREGKRWPMVLAVVLAVIQFWFTWLLPAYRFETLLSFGGIGGELYLCTLLMVSFFFPLPEYFRWDFYRYPVVVGAAFTFWGQFGLWQQINRGQASIPWGSLWGGESSGDMNNLSAAGWSDQQIINTYSTLSHLCLWVLLGVYLYFAVRQNRHAIFALTQRWLAQR
ncbi:hypothetical protein [Leptolyngbya iicbica]|uniref:Uncharacterized protein n=2 Tax=Cyanophyceae TaxID=3028117 RepID=A0A4Q7E9Q8_9CYAN|nr:hypothetical protein [Leptolyngbya sp. LK]RZM79174.1 hypothetical protein DYY88_10480 [Leptolyngbya sp. LK]